ncbi:hypothetical protein STURO_v1c08410 [Spiroplasma turonicum]|nr:hypothetical protein STURO_v1c08410 [Spiroplasma turonicum]
MLKKIFISIFSSALISSTTILSTSCSTLDFEYTRYSNNFTIIKKYLENKAEKNKHVYTKDEKSSLEEWIFKLLNTIKLSDYQIVFDSNDINDKNKILIDYKYDSIKPNYFGDGKEIIYVVKTFIYFENSWKSLANYSINNKSDITIKFIYNGEE